MKKFTFIFLSLAFISTTSCVQKAYEKTVTFIVDVSKIKGIETVGLRGNDKPLSWQGDLAMTALVKDSLYTANVTYLTGYKFTEVKFVVNGEFELQDKDNRRVAYSESDTTVYRAVYGVEK